MCSEWLVPGNQAPLPCVALVPAGSMQRGHWLPVYTVRADTLFHPQRKPTLFRQMKSPLQCFQDQSGICTALIVRVGWSPGPLSHTRRDILHNSLQALQAFAAYCLFPVPPLVLPPPAHTGAAERTVVVYASLKNEDRKISSSSSCPP